MEDESPNDHIIITKSSPLLMKTGSGYVIGCIVAEINHMTAEFKQYHEIIDYAPPEKEVFKLLLEKEFVPTYSERWVMGYD